MSLSKKNDVSLSLRTLQSSGTGKKQDSLGQKVTQTY